MFEVIPAIDLRNGQCVRLVKGKIGTETYYYKNPVDALKHWKGLGAKTIHVVDLDAAFGTGNNMEIIRDLVKFSGDDVSIQVGGGIRDEKIASDYIKLGVKRIVVGTAAIKKPTFVKKLEKEHGKDKIMVALDHKNENVMIKGWTKDSGKNLYEMGAIMEKNGAGSILLSSVEADGAFEGPDFQSTRKMIERIQIPVFAAGGTRNLEDVIKLRDIGASGVIIGKALYEGKIDLGSALHFNMF
ncbi:MAG: 1-(5-phosphoribosyl)-5-[(5-phosphoribosylamino)methylideneamino]imidazole-4-carboxamide isomerase [Promethearchaeota archaeon]